MLKKFLVLSAVCLSLTAQAANEEPLVEDSLVSRETSISEMMLRPLEPTYTLVGLEGQLVHWNQ